MGKPELTFTLDEIEALIAQAQRDPELVGFTSRELAEAAGCSIKVARERYVRPLVRAGLARLSPVLRRPELSPYWTHVQGYELIKEEGTCPSTRE